KPGSRRAGPLTVMFEILEHCLDNPPQPAVRSVASSVRVHLGPGGIVEGLAMADGMGETRISRRELVRRAGVGAGGLPLGGLTGAVPALAGPRAADADEITIGFVSPITGPAAGFGEGDPYIVGLARKAWADGITVNGKKYAVRVITKDGQSNPQRGSQVAQDLIQGQNV